MAKLKRWKKRPEGANWGDFGPDDQKGRLNLLDAAAVLRGAEQVKVGRNFCLSLPLDLPGGNVLNPRRHPPQLQPTIRGGGRQTMNYPLRLDGHHDHATDVICDDTVILTLQYSTQWDSFAHVGQLFDADDDGRAEMVYYNGYRANEHVIGPVDWLEDGAELAAGPIGARALGIDTMAVSCVQGRGVMIDLQAHLGPGRTLVGYAELRRILEADKVTIAPGDMVCLRTGFADALVAMAGKPDAAQLKQCGAELDGRDPELLRWVTDSGIAALIADNYSVEAHPSRPCNQDQCAELPLHEHCLFKLGVPLGELWLLSELADWLRAHGRSHFMLTAPPLRLPGAVGSPTTPVATV